MVQQLQLFAQAEIKRLDSRWVWNGRAKAQAIKNTLGKLNNFDWEHDENMKKSPAIAARASGLVDALAIHRHTFFSHSNKAKSHESLFNSCPAVKSGM
ncbi:MAG: hypothetical protein Q8M03_00575 [Legionella sp.]|nr:hypothetical protein [Legionella sp.]